MEDYYAETDHQDPFPSIMEAIHKGLVPNLRCLDLSYNRDNLDRELCEILGEAMATGKLGHLDSLSFHMCGGLFPFRGRPVLQVKVTT